MLMRKILIKCVLNCSLTKSINPNLAYPGTEEGSHGEGKTASLISFQYITSLIEILHFSPHEAAFTQARSVCLAGAELAPAAGVTPSCGPEVRHLTTFKKKKAMYYF